MHESIFGKQVLNVVLMRAWEARAQRVERVEGWVSDHTEVDRAAVADHFASLAKGTAAEGAKLDLAAVLGEPSVGVESIEVA